MSEWSLALGRALQGAVDVAEPMMADKRRADIDKQRDERLQGYTAENRAANQEFSREQAGIAEAAQERRHGETMTVRGQQHTERMDAAGTSADLRQAGLVEQRRSNEAGESARTRQLDLTERQIDMSEEANAITLKLARINLTTAEGKADALKVLADTDASPEQVAAALRKYNIDQEIKIVQEAVMDEFGNRTGEYNYAIFRGSQQINAAPTATPEPGIVERARQPLGRANQPSTAGEFEDGRIYEDRNGKRQLWWQGEWHEDFEEIPGGSGRPAASAVGGGGGGGF